MEPFAIESSGIQRWRVFAIARFANDGRGAHLVWPRTLTTAPSKSGVTLKDMNIARTRVAAG